MASIIITNSDDSIPGGVGAQTVSGTDEDIYVFGSPVGGDLLNAGEIHVTGDNTATGYFGVGVADGTTFTTELFHNEAGGIVLATGSVAGSKVGGFLGGIDGSPGVTNDGLIQVLSAGVGWGVASQADAS